MGARVGELTRFGRPCGRVTAATTLDGQAAPDLDPVIPAADGDPFDALATKLRTFTSGCFTAKLT